MPERAIDSSPFHRPTLERFRAWVDAGVSVEGRPEWVFVKVHTHGTQDHDMDTLLGAPVESRSAVPSPV